MDPAEGQGVWTQYTVQDGLPDLKIERLYEDRDGFLWIGTHDRGVARFDGVHFATLTIRDGLPSNGVYSILADREGALWFTTREGLTRYREGQCERVPVASPQPRTFLWGSCMDLSGALWFAVEDRPGEPPAVCRWDGTALALIPLSANPDHLGRCVDGVAVDREGRLWMKGNVLYQYDGSGYQAVAYPGEVILALLPRPEGTLWVATTAGLFVYEQGTFHRLCAGFDDRAQGVRCMVEDEAGRVWLATLDGRVIGYDGVAFRSIRTLDSPVQALCLDRMGRLWVGTYGNGLFCYDVTRFQLFGPAQGLPSSRVYCLAEQREGPLWIGTEAGLVAYDGTAFRPLENAVALTDQPITALWVDRGDQLWIGVQDGRLYTASSGGVCPVLDGQRPLGCLVEDGEGRIWVGFTSWWRPDSPYQGGLAYGQDGQGQVFIGTPAGPNQVEALWVDRAGTLWAGLWNPDQHHGLYRSTGAALEPVGWNPRPLADRVRIQVLYEDRAGHLWIGTHAGVYRYDGR